MKLYLTEEGFRSSETLRMICSILFCLLILIIGQIDQPTKTSSLRGTETFFSDKKLHLCHQSVSLSARLILIHFRFLFDDLQRSLILPFHIISLSEVSDLFSSSHNQQRETIN